MAAIVFSFGKIRKFIVKNKKYGLFYYKAKSIDGLSHTEERYDIQLATPEFLPWHMSLFVHEGVIYTIIACVKKGDPRRIIQHIGIMDVENGELTICETPLTDYNSYRSSAYVDEDGTFVLYNATLHENVAGCSSVDGRDILVAKCPFHSILSELQKCTL